MSVINWRALPNGNVEVTNYTADLYRYFDCTDEAEFLYECVHRTIENDLPREIDYLKRHDAAMTTIMNAIEMPDRLADDFIMFVRQNGGKLPKRRREKEFAKLSDKEVALLEKAIDDAFEGFPDTR
ncbi:hypothetical protein [Sulfitobacter sp.]|uniref:hypothetical protein n=1 Tax=Sulfitobacter sp. TaxID=1903071 RepID=UPI0035637C6C